MTHIKTASEIEVMRDGGKKLAKIRDRLLKELKPGSVPLQIDNLAKKLIAEAGGSPSFVTVGDYQWATCISVNDGVVHGIPTDKPFNEGDAVGLDVGLFYQGFHTDTSWSKLVGSRQEERSREKEKFLQVGEEALDKAISQAKPGNRIGHISQAIQTTIEGAGYSVVRSLVGHGVGSNLHEPPQVPGVLTKRIEKTPPLFKGMVLAIEVIYNKGKPDIVYKNNDGWTLVTADGSLSGLFEQTVLITQNEPSILTASSL
ncbi:MAG: type I methionyl aminopeptidase [Patescibacteria group bacterium]